MKTKQRKPPSAPSPVQPDEQLNRIWQSVFCPYREHPNTALVLAQNFQAIKDTLNQPGGEGEVMQSLDDAIEMLFQYSTFYGAGRDLFHMAVEGRLLPEHDPSKLAEAARAATIGG